MGERIAFRFVLSAPVEGFATTPSPWLYSHWDGPTIIERAIVFTGGLKHTCTAPEGRRKRRGIRADPSTAMIVFIIDNIGRESMVDRAPYRLYNAPPGASDWGDWEVDLLTGLIRPYGSEEWTEAPSWDDMEVSG